MTQTFIPIIMVCLLSAMLGAAAGALWGLSQHRHIYDWLSASFINRMQTAMRSLCYSQEDIDRLLSRMGQRIMPSATPPPPTPTKDAEEKDEKTLKEEGEPAGLGPVTITFLGKSLSEEQKQDYLQRIDIVYPEDADHIEKEILTNYVLQYAEKILMDTSEEQTRRNECEIHKAWMELYGSSYRDCRTEVGIFRRGEKVKVVFMTDFIY